MARRRQESARPPPPSRTRPHTKKNSSGILHAFQQFWLECGSAFDQQRVAERAEALALSSLLCLGRHTVTGMLTTCGREFQDWSADYRLFSHGRFPVEEIFAVIRRGVLSELPPQSALCVAVDDTLLRKSGLRIPGVAWRRDPLGPPFQTNLLRAQRFLQFSAAVPLAQGAYRMVPICFDHAPTPVKPTQKASAEQVQQYRQAARLARLPLRAVQRMAALRSQLDAEPDGAQRFLRFVVDGGYTNRTTLKDLPSRSGLVGRIRKDAKLFFPPPEPASQARRGRPRRYGPPSPTPEQLRTDESVPWTCVEISITGHAQQLRVKCLKHVLWRTAGLKHTLQLVVIAPLGYRLRKRSKLLYRQPAFLISTEPDLDVCELVQAFVQRWDIEVNFREEKTLLGVGQAQVRTPHSATAVPALQVAAYAMLLLATLRTIKGPAKPDLLPPAKWASDQIPRYSTQRAINQLRAETWGHALGLTNFSDFATRLSPAAKSEKLLPDLGSAVLYATN